MDKSTISKKRAFTLLAVLSMLGQVAFAQNSLYSDVKAKKVGDIITVILKESTTGSSSSDSKLQTSADGQAEGSISGNFLPFEPVFGSGANVNFGSDQKNSSTQRQLLEGFLSVQIIEVTPTGDLIVKGSRLTEVNGEVHEMKITGTVRQNDIDGNNMVMSYLIANANISYMKKGGIKDKKKDNGFLKKVMFGAVSAGLTAAAILKGLNNN